MAGEEINQDKKIQSQSEVNKSQEQKFQENLKTIKSVLDKNDDTKNGKKLEDADKIDFLLDSNFEKGLKKLSSSGEGRQEIKKMFENVNKILREDFKNKGSNDPDKIAIFSLKISLASIIENMPKSEKINNDTNTNQSETSNNEIEDKNNTTKKVIADNFNELLTLNKIFSENKTSIDLIDKVGSGLDNIEKGNKEIGKKNLEEVLSSIKEINIQQISDGKIKSIISYLQSLKGDIDFNNSDNIDDIRKNTESINLYGDRFNIMRNIANSMRLNGNLIIGTGENLNKAKGSDGKWSTQTARDNGAKLAKFDKIAMENGELRLEETKTYKIKDIVFHEGKAFQIIIEESEKIKK